MAALRTIFPILLAGALLQGASGLYAVIVPLALEAQGVSAFWNGATAGVYSLGFLIGCFVGPAYVRSVGHIRAFAGFAAVASVIVLGLALDVDLVLTTIVRGLLGVCLAVLLSVNESWVADGTPEDSRGGVISLYYVLVKVALMLGPFVVAAFDAAVLPVFMTASALFSLALVPVTLTKIDNPTAPSDDIIGPRIVFRTAPTAAAGALTAGVVNGGVLALLPVFGARLGFSTVEISLTVAAAHLFSLIVQWPAGKISDYVDRRLVILILAVTAAAGALLVATLSLLATPIVIVGLIGLWGAASLSSYSICLAHGADLFAKDQIVGMGSTLLLLFAGGQIVGPLGAAALMNFGPWGLFAFAGAGSALFAVFILWRLATQRREWRSSADFQAAPNGTPLLYEADPRAPAQ